MRTWSYVWRNELERLSPGIDTGSDAVVLFVFRAVCALYSDNQYVSYVHTGAALDGTNQTVRTLAAAWRKCGEHGTDSSGGLDAAGRCSENIFVPYAFGENFGLLAGIELLLGGFSIFMGTLVVRFGNKLGILVGMLLGAIFGGTSVAAIDLVKGDVNAMQAWVSVDVSMNVNVIFAVVGVATYLVSGILAVRMTQKIEAKL